MFTGYFLFCLFSRLLPEMSVAFYIVNAASYGHIA